MRLTLPGLTDLLKWSPTPEKLSIVFLTLEDVTECPSACKISNRGLIMDA